MQPVPPFSCSLTEDFIPSSMAVLRESGSIQELGKRGAWSTVRMATASAATPVVIDLATDIPSDLGWTNRLLQKLAARLRCDIAHGLPTVEFPLSRVHDAFQLLKSGGNVGKVLLSSPFMSLTQVRLRWLTRTPHTIPAHDHPHSSPITFHSTLLHPTPPPVPYPSTPSPSRRRPPT